MSDINRLKVEAEGFEILFAEDNEALRNQAGALLKKLFGTVYLAGDGEVALGLFREHHPQIVITDIKMPRRDGLDLTRMIKALKPETKVIVMSAFDDREHLHEAIDCGVFRFLKKPASVTDLSEALLDAIKAIKDEEQNRIFYTQLSDVFNYQSALVVMMQERTILLASERFLDFFGVESIEGFIAKRDNIGACLLKHSGFLYNEPSRDWFIEASSHPDRLFHVKMADDAHKMHHFIFKLHHVPEKKDYTILSFDDITELQLLDLFDGKKSRDDRSEMDQKAIFDLLGVIERNHAKVKLHNFYRGLSITNDAVVVDAKNGLLQLKSNFLQQKAIQIEKRTVLSSEALPHDIICEALKKINFEDQSIHFESVHFLSRSPVERKTIRVEPAQEHTVTLFFNEHKFFGETRIVDLSKDAVKISMDALPAGLEPEERVRLDMILTLDKRQIIINTEAILYKKTEQNRLFYLVFTLDLPTTMVRPLTEYISKRQMELIREFKGLQYGN